MALLGTIRNRFGWVMMGLIFVGMLSFLFMDISPGSNAPGGSSRTVGEVNGEKISSDLVQQYTQDYQGGQYLSEEISEYVWRRIVDEKLVGQRTSEAGMLVSPKEMGDMFMSSDPALLSPTIKNYFGDRQKGGAVNTEEIKQRVNLFHNTSALLKQATTQQQREELLEQQKAWINLEKTVKKERLRSKYFDALNMGVYTPSWMVEMEHKTQETSYNFDYVRIPYINITDKVEVSDQELTDYIAANPRKYKREATANVNYILFDVAATPEDSAAYQGEMEVLAEEFGKEGRSMKEDSAFIGINYGEFPATYFTEVELSEPREIIDSIFDAEEGTVFGPYIHNNKYRILKKIEQKELPDSVRTRHILIGAQDPQAGQRAKTLLDSIKNVLETDPNASFDSLAMKYSEDPGSKIKGGDLGWKAKDGSFVPQFEDYMFYIGEKDSLGFVYTKYGVHLIQITDYKYETDKEGVRIATVDMDIIPSSGTTEKKQREVIDFITNNRKVEDMKAAAKELGLTVNTAAGLEEGGYNITGIGKNSTSADIVRWAHNPETTVGEVTNRPYSIENEELNCTDKFVVTALVSKAPKGLATIDDPKVKADVDRIIRNEKKTEAVKAKLASLTSLDAIAGEYSLIKESATNVQYGSANMGGTIGVEPKVAALAAATPAGEMSGAIGGKEGVYVLQMTSVTEAPAITNVASSRTRINSRISQMVSRNIFENMKENSTIEDNRSKY